MDAKEDVGGDRAVHQHSETTRPIYVLFLNCYSENRGLAGRTRAVSDIYISSGDRRARNSCPPVFRHFHRDICSSFLCRPSTLSRNCSRPSMRNGAAVSRLPDKLQSFPGNRVNSLARDAPISRLSRVLDANRFLLFRRLVRCGSIPE